MTSIKQGLSQVSKIDRDFTGTVAFRNDQIALPDGSKVAVGIDGERWVIVHQKAPKAPFVIYEYNADKSTILVDKRNGGPDDIGRVREIINYFFEHAQTEDVVTIESEGA